MLLKRSSSSDEIISKDLKAVPSQNRVVVNGQEQVVQPKVMQLLVLLCQSPGVTLTKQYLMETIWPGLVVGQESLANIVARLRRALNDSSKQPVYIETVQGKGYRWIAPVEANKPESIFQHKLMIPAAALVLVLLVGTGIRVFFQHDEERADISDLKITPTEEGVEIAVGLETDLTSLDEEAMLKEVKNLTGLDVEKENVEIKIDKDQPSDENQ